MMIREDLRDDTRMGDHSGGHSREGADGDGNYDRGVGNSGSQTGKWLSLYYAMPHLHLRCLRFHLIFSSICSDADVTR
jgi:hypothetical protein